ncbi:MAG: glycosyl hydrolase family 28 protein [Planctomycetia bacterium]|nr:glycosyl hydrolase family 28 protein [Planctomycetia bacterium]
MKKLFAGPGLAIVFLFLLTAISTPGFADTEMIKIVDTWLQEQILKQVHEHKSWTWVIPIPSEDHFPTYTVTVNGKKVDVTKFQEISYVDIPYAAQWDIEITANIPLESIRISPRSYSLSGTLEPSSPQVWKFSLDKPRKLLLTINDDYRLFVFANGPETYPITKEGENVVLLSQYAADPTGQRDATSEIQRAIDDTSKIRGTLYIPQGVYRIDQLRIKADMTMYLERGAVLKLSDDIEKHLKIREENLKFGVQFISPILCYKVKNIRICGYGTIDGNGEQLALRNDFTTRGFYRLVHAVDCQNIHLCDVILKNPQRWNTHLANSENILMENVKIVNSINICNTDAIDPDNCKNVEIRDVFAYSSDDSVVLKTSDRWHDGTRREEEFLSSENIHVCDCVFWTRANALKIGTEKFRDIRNVTFENNDILHTYSILTIELKEGSKTSHVQFLNNRVDVLGDVSGGRVLHFAVRRYIYPSQKTEVVDRPSYGQLTDVLVKDLFVENVPSQMSKIEGWDERSFVKMVVFENVWMGGQKIVRPEQLSLEIGKFASDVQFR